MFNDEYTDKLYISYERTESMKSNEAILIINPTEITVRDEDI